MFSDCPVAVSLPSLSQAASCHLSKQCTEATCCINVPILKRSFQIAFNLDACNYTVSASIEKLQYSQSLLEFHFGKIVFYLSAIRTLPENTL